MCFDFPLISIMPLQVIFSAFLPLSYQIFRPSVANSRKVIDAIHSLLVPDLPSAPRRFIPWFRLNATYTQPSNRMFVLYEVDWGSIPGRAISTT